MTKEMAGDTTEENLTSELIRLGAKKLIQEMLEAAVTENWAGSATSDPVGMIGAGAKATDRCA